MCVSEKNAGDKRRKAEESNQDDGRHEGAAGREEPGDGLVEEIAVGTDQLGSVPVGCEETLAQLATSGDSDE